MFEIRVNRNIISVQEVEPLTSGSVSVYQCHFTFDASWDGFFRSAVFRVGSLVKTLPLDNTDICDLPWELLEKQNIGLAVEVSVYGTKDETEILPTIWDKLGRVRGGAEPGEDVSEFTPSVYDRLVSLIKLYSDKVKGDKGDKGDPGEGDMSASVYDPQNKKTDIFGYVDDAIGAIPDWAMQAAKPKYTASEVGALPSLGGTIEGDLKLRKAANGYSSIVKNHSATADYGTQILDYDADGDSVMLQLRALTNAARLYFGANYYDILHTGNKPSGSYTGNGDATARTIATGGIGNIILLWSGSALWLVAGAICLQCADGVWSKITGATFINGTLSLTTASSPNAINSTYRYQVL